MTPRVSLMKVAQALVAVLLLLAAACQRQGDSAPPGAPAGPAVSISGLLADAPGGGPDGDGGAGYARALVARPFTFPDDDGPHPGFRSEWWYFTGVLRAPGAAGHARRFGYQMTIFRQALAPARSPRPSSWATRDVFMGHLAITDVDGRAGGTPFHAYQRFARDGLALAGAGIRPFAVWVDDWRMDGPAGGRGALTALPIQLVAGDEDGSALALQVGDGQGDVNADGTSAPRPAIAQGDRGLSAKGPTPGNASFYYSRTRLPTRGRITVAGDTAHAVETFQVAGTSWMDREWSTSSLSAGVRGWDWLGIQLSDGRDLMMYRLRGADGQPTAESRLTLIAADGQTRHFGPDAFTLTPLEVWLSPHSGARYPTSFRLDLPGESLRLVVRPLVNDQELRLAVVYWEGAVSVAGTSTGEPLGGEGYLELTGYAAGAGGPR